LVYLCIAAEQV